MFGIRISDTTSLKKIRSQQNLVFIGSIMVVSTPFMTLCWGWVLLIMKGFKPIAHLNGHVRVWVCILYYFVVGSSTYLSIIFFFLVVTS